jgi:hypothetical protein
MSSAGIVSKMIRDPVKAKRFQRAPMIAAWKLLSNVNNWLMRGKQKTGKEDEKNEYEVRHIS